MNTCDICGSDKDVTTGRWIFYCPKHKHVDQQKTYDNELAPALESGNLDDYSILEDCGLI